MHAPHCTPHCEHMRKGTNVPACLGKAPVSSGLSDLSVCVLCACNQPVIHTPLLNPRKQPDLLRHEKQIR